MKTTLVWLQRELRLQHNPALVKALNESDRVIVAYFHDPEATLGDANNVWLANSLLALQKDLHARGGALWMIEGNFAKEFSQLIQAYKPTQVLYNFQVGQPFRDHQEQALDICQRCKVALQPQFSEFWFDPGTILNGQKKPYVVFTPFYKASLKHIDRLQPLDNPESLPWEKVSVQASNPLWLNLPKHLEALMKRPWAEKVMAHWKVGESAAWEMLDTFIEHHLNDYDENRDVPNLEATSMLSPYLHFGEISSRAIYFYIMSLQESGVSTDSQPWLRQLLWREFARLLMWYFPYTETLPFQTKFEQMEWQEPSDDTVAWQKGLTGIPIVDAGMRQLWETGFMHNRVRMLVASFLTKNLNQCWVEGKEWFDDTLVDADPSNNVMGWQWVAGCGVDAAPYYRLFNPVRQSETFDPEGDYIRKWVPELSHLSKKAIHAPWEHPMECQMKGIKLGENYPMPLVDLAKSRVEHLERVNSLKESHRAMSA